MKTKRFPVALLPWIQRMGLHDCTFVEVNAPTEWRPEDDPTVASWTVEETPLSLCRRHGSHRYYAGVTEPLDARSAKTPDGTRSMRLCYWLVVPSDTLDRNPCIFP